MLYSCCECDVVKLLVMRCFLSRMQFDRCNFSVLWDYWCRFLVMLGSSRTIVFEVAQIFLTPQGTHTHSRFLWIFTRSLLPSMHPQVNLKLIQNLFINSFTPHVPLIWNLSGLMLWYCLKITLISDENLFVERYETSIDLNSDETTHFCYIIKSKSFKNNFDIYQRRFFL